MLRRLPVPHHRDLLIGNATGDDAAVWRVSDDRAMVATVDVFTPIVDDARTWGAIAAANSASDVYAMGGQPLFALNIAGWPRAELSLDLLADVLEGASEVAERGRWLVIGGHTIDAVEPFFGQTVVGDVHPDRIIANHTAQPGQAIILTKPIGTGIVSTAAKRLDASAVAPGGSIAVTYAAAVASMVRLNDAAADVARRFEVRAGTDITGFGLLGHLHKLALASGVALQLFVDRIPIFPGVAELLEQGFVPDGTSRNLDFVVAHLDVSRLADAPRTLDLLGDPQTSGGLALCLRADRAADAVAELHDSGHRAAVIGLVSSGPAGSITVEP